LTESRPVTEWTEGIPKNELELHFAEVVKAAREQVLSGHYHSPVVMPGGTEDDEASLDIACDNTGLITSSGFGAARSFGRKPESACAKRGEIVGYFGLTRHLTYA
jgi:hypothetical protein